MPGIPESRRALPELTSVRQENDHPATSTRLKPTGGNLGIPLMLVIITALSFAVFPGHSWLQIDSQIYVAIMLHQEHPDILAKDPVAVHSHTAGTLYDEISLSVSRFSGGSLRQVLETEQLIFLALGIAGVFLIATSLRLSPRMALIVAAIFALGANVVGPSIFTVEYEPIPRAFALGLILLGIGLAGHRRYTAAAIAGAVAVLFHPPTVIPFAFVFALHSLISNLPLSSRLIRLLPFLVSAIVMAIAMRASDAGPTHFLDRIEAVQTQVQMDRDSYVFVSQWFPGWGFTYFLLWGISMLAVLRIWRDAGGARFYLLAMPAFGMLSVPLSWVITEKLGLTIGPQIQPARAILFVVLFAIICGVTAGIKAVERKHFGEAFIWFFVSVGAVVQNKFQDLIRFPRMLHNELAVTLCICALLMLAASTSSITGEATSPRWSILPWLAAVCAPAFLIASFVHERLPLINPADVHAVAAWAAANTPRDSVFLFPDTDTDAYPGIFRVEAQRAIYVDWRSGGQVNFVKNFGPEWLARWRETRASALPAQPVDRAELLAKKGIEYVVVHTGNAWPGMKPLFGDSQFTAYRIAPER